MQGGVPLGSHQGSSQSEHERQLAQPPPPTHTHTPQSPAGRAHAPVGPEASRACGLRPGALESPREGWGGVWGRRIETDYWALPPEAKTFGICIFNGLLNKVVHLQMAILWPHLNFKCEDAGGRASQPWLHIRITWGA